MLIKMLKSFCACNDGVHSTRYHMGQEVIVPSEITRENAKVFLDNGIAELIAEDIAPPTNVPLASGKEGVEGDVEIFDINDDEDGLEGAPDIVKKLTDKPLFSRNKKRK